MAEFEPPGSPKPEKNPAELMYALTTTTLKMFRVPQVDAENGAPEKMTINSDDYSESLELATSTRPFNDLETQPYEPFTPPSLEAQHPTEGTEEQPTLTDPVVNEASFPIGYSAERRRLLDPNADINLAVVPASSSSDRRPLPPWHSTTTTIAPVKTSSTTQIAPVPSIAETTPVPHKAVTGPVSNKAVTAPVPSIAETTPVPHKAVTGPVSNKAVTAPVPSIAETTPVPHKAVTEPVSNKAVTAPVSSTAVKGPSQQSAHEFFSTTPSGTTDSTTEIEGFEGYDHHEKTKVSTKKNLNPESGADEAKVTERQCSQQSTSSSNGAGTFVSNLPYQHVKMRAYRNRETSICGDLSSTEIEGFEAGPSHDTPPDDETTGINKQQGIVMAIGLTITLFALILLTLTPIKRLK